MVACSYRVNEFKEHISQGGREGGSLVGGKRGEGPYILSEKCLNDGHYHYVYE